MSAETQRADLRIGVVGLGAMGLPIASNLAASGRQVRGCDRSAERMSAAAAAGLATAELPELARWASHLLVVVRDEDQLDRLVEAHADALSPDNVVVVMSTLGTTCVAQLASRLAGAGVQVVDAPIMSGNDEDAAAARLDIVVAGPPGPAAVAAEILGACGTATVVGGEVGAAQAAKLTCQVMQAAGIVATLEALRYAARQGVDEAAVLPLLQRGSARSWALDNLERVRRMWAQPGDPFDLIHKDLLTVLGDGLPEHIELPLTAELAARFRRRGRAAGGEEST